MEKRSLIRRIRVGFGLAMLVSVVIFAALFYAARAEEQAIVKGIFCDSQQQVEDFLSAWDEDDENPTERVNQAAGKADACGRASFLVAVTRTIRIARTKNIGSWKIIQVDVRGHASGFGVQPYARTRIQYTAMRVQGTDL